MTGLQIIDIRVGGFKTDLFSKIFYKSLVIGSFLTNKHPGYTLPEIRLLNCTVLKVLYTYSRLEMNPPTRIVKNLNPLLVKLLAIIRVLKPSRIPLG